MKFVSTAWLSGSLAEFEAHCSLKAHAACGLASQDVPFDIYILDGFHKLEASYVTDLEVKHIRLHDASKTAGIYVERYGGIADLIGPGQGAVYELFCFIRWLVLDDLLGGSSFVHFDADLFFQRRFEELAPIFEGLTGTFGSPCLTIVSTREWMVTYRTSLDQLLVDRMKLQDDLGYEGTEFRADISSDQDLVVALERRDRIPADGLRTLHNDFQVFINPLWPYQRKPYLPYTYARIDGEDLVGGKPVLFWHLQNNFADYISRYATVVNFEQTWLKAFLPVRLNLPFIQLEPSAENFAFQALREIAWRNIKSKLSSAGPGVLADLGELQFFARSWVSEWFIVQGNGRGLFSHGYWWEDGVFAQVDKV